jgi:hypothetical protein
MKSLLIGLLLCSVAFLSSCSFRKYPEPYRVPAPANAKKEVNTIKSDGELLAGIKSVAVLPFVDASSGVGHTINNGDMLMFGERFASHLVASKTFTNVMYPNQALQKLVETPFNVNRVDDLKEIGNLLNVDAILFGKINQYRMYYPPQLSLSMKFYLTRMKRFANSFEISALAHSGTPLHEYNPTFFKQLWDTSAYYDGSNSSVSKKLGHYLKTHKTDFYGNTSDRVLRTKEDFFNFIAYDLTNSLNYNKNSEEYMRPNGKGKKRRNESKRPRRLPSGYYHR